MATIFGFQIVLTLIAASVLQKLSARYSFGRWLLCRKLIHYLYPTNDVLKAVLAQNQGGKALKKKKPDKKNLERNEIFSVPKSIDVPILSAPVSSLDVLQLPYYVDYRWLIDFTFYSLIVFGISELYSTIFPINSSKELNLSLVWIGITLVVSMKSLATITALYFRGMGLSGERSLCISFGAICFLLTMVIFLFSDNLLDIGLLEAHRNFTHATAVFMQKMDLAAPQERSPILLYFLMSIMFGFLASFLTFPCLRYSRMYNDALKYANERHVEKLLIHASFFAPMFVLLLWFRPLARDHLVEGKDAILTSAQFESLRLWASLLPVILRFFMARIHLQSYLNVAFDKVADLKKEAGRITNVDLQKMIANVFYYLCVVAVQYFAPVVLLLAMTCILKSLGNYSWLDILPEEQLQSLQFFAEKVAFFPPNSNGTLESTTGQLLAPSLGHLRQIFNQQVNRGVWNFFLFSTSFINFFGSLVGVVFVMRFSES